MIKTVLHGCSGHMGRIVAGLIQNDPRFETVAGVDAVDRGDLAFPVFASLKEVNVAYDVVIDFSTAAAVDALLSDAVAAKKPLVLCTTGLSAEQEAKVTEAAKTIPVFFSANMSLGVNLLTELVRKAAKILAPAGFDIEIEERHHHRKLDAPSGTALSIGRAMIEELNDGHYMTTDRAQKRAARDPKEIGMSSVRGGTIVGEHDVIFAGEDEILEVRHTALSRAIFGNGALNAAAFLMEQPAGQYSMKDLLSEA